MFSFTPQERRIILFLIGVALAGTAINFLAKRSDVFKAEVCLNENLGKVDINKADLETLMIIPGIGKKLAERIIEYRSLNSGFYGIEDLKNVKGFKGYRFEKVKRMIYVQ